MIIHLEPTKSRSILSGEEKAMPAVSLPFPYVHTLSKSGSETSRVWLYPGQPHTSKDNSEGQGCIYTKMAQPSSKNAVCEKLPYVDVQSFILGVCIKYENISEHRPSLIGVVTSMSVIRLVGDLSKYQVFLPWWHAQDSLGAKSSGLYDNAKT